MASQDLSALVSSLRPSLKHLGSGFKHLDTVDSTNRFLLELAKDGAPEGMVVVADVQTLGRGRLSREWVSPRGGLWMSILLRPESGSITMLPLMAGVAVARCLRNIGVDAGLKWPNDVLVGGKKVCGILLEGGRDGIAAGLGINLNFSADQLPKELESSATSIQDILGQQVDRGVLLAELLECMDGLYSSFKQNDNRILEEWRSLSITLGKKVAITTPSGAIEGVAVDIDEHGGLILDLGGERVKVLAGDCVHLR